VRFLTNSGVFLGMKHVSRWTVGDGGAYSFAPGRRVGFEKDRTGPLNAVHRRPPSGRTDFPVENTAVEIGHFHPLEARSS